MQHVAAYGYAMIRAARHVVRMMPELFTAERYRQEASRIRRAAMAMHDAWVRWHMLGIADQYDGLAETVEKQRFPQSRAAD
jgi:hypothetical protein